MLTDLRHAYRALLRARGFTVVTVLTLALGIGAAAGIFSVVDWVLFRSQSFPANLYLVGGQSKDAPFMPVRFDYMVQAYAEQDAVFANLAKSTNVTGNVVVDGEPVATSWLAVTPNFLSMLEIAPALGRGFLPGEDLPGRDEAIVISHPFWQSHLKGDPDVLGRHITLGESVCTVVGVLRQGQTLPPYFFSEVFRPLSYTVDPAQPWAPQFFVLAALRPGVSPEQARDALIAASPAVPQPLQGFIGDDRPALSPVASLNSMMRSEIYWVMLGAVGFLYAIACLNASNLMLVRMLGQRRELSIRLALGGGRWRIIRLLATESIVLAALAALFGTLIANWLLPLFMSIGGTSFNRPTWTSWSLNGRVLAVLGGLTLVTCLLITVIPAVRVLRSGIHAGLKDGGASLGESPALARLRGLFVVLQAAFAVILLTGAGLMVRTFQNVQTVDLGFDPAGRAKVMLGFPPDYPSGNEARLAKLNEIQTALQHLPGVRDVSFGTDLLMSGFYFPTMTLAGADGTPIKAALGNFLRGYAETAGITLKRGRWLDQINGNEIMVNEAFARLRWPEGSDPVGQLVRSVGPNQSAGPEWQGWVVAGVVGDLKDTMREPAHPFIYGPEGWNPTAMNAGIVRLTQAYDETLAGSIRRALYTYDPRIVVARIQPLDRARNDQLWAETLAFSVLNTLAVIAVLLTVVGIFSVVAYTVDRRMNEFGVRLALGATPRHLVDLVLRRGVLLTAIGVVIGVGGALGLTRYLQSLLFETAANDPWVLGGVAFSLLAIAAIACALPARRAARVDITKLLRAE